MGTWHVVVATADDEISGSAAWAIVIGVSALVAASGWLVIEIAKRTADGRLGRNGWAGVRTRATRSSDEAWLAAHQVALRPTVAGGWLAVVLAVVAVAAAATVGTDDVERMMAVWGTVMTIGGLALAALVAFGGLRGHRAAKALGNGDTAGPLTPR